MAADGWTLDVIGVGYPRTGTMSLKHAIEALGFGRCYHMIEVFDRPDDCTFWMNTRNGGAALANWQDVFSDYGATSDCPGCCYWKELAVAFPEARFILTVRDPEEWYESFRTTVYHAMTHPEDAPDEAHRRVQQMASALILDDMFAGQFEDRDYAIGRYEQHRQEVIAAIPAEQLLIFRAADGWGPLCQFLNRPQPDTPFPRINSREEFRSRFHAKP